MILHKLISNKNSKKFFLSIAVVFAIALAVVGRATFGGVVSEYNMPYSNGQPRCSSCKGRW
nr:inner membrane protein [Raoultella sp. NCTC 9187]